jgi:hypothetical protein
VLFGRGKSCDCLIFLNAQATKENLKIVFVKENLAAIQFSCFFLKEKNWVLFDFHVLLRRGELGGC